MIYRIHPDHQKYKSFVINSKTARRALGQETLFHFSRAPEPYLEHWHSFEIEFASMSSRKSAVIPDIMVRNGRLFFSEAAHASIGRSLSNDGEFLPITYGGHNGYIFNVLSLAEDNDALDNALCTKNEFDEVQSLGFIEEKLDDIQAFRTEFDGYLGIYCSDAMKSAIQNAHLNGIIFSTDLGNIFPADDMAQKPARH